MGSNSGANQVVSDAICTGGGRQQESSLNIQTGESSFVTSLIAYKIENYNISKCRYVDRQSHI